MRSKCDCAHRRVKKNPPDPEIAPRRVPFFVSAERNRAEQGMRARRCTERDCGRRRRQKCTLFTRTIVGLIEPERLVKVRRARGIGSARHCPRRASIQWEGPWDPPGSWVFPVVKKYDLIWPVKSSETSSGENRTKLTKLKKVYVIRNPDVISVISLGIANLRTRKFR